MRIKSNLNNKISNIIVCPESHAYRVLVGKPEGKRLLGRPRHTWQDNIKWILNMPTRRVWTRLSWLRTGTSGGLL
jgi:hypothetical protein